MLNFSIILIIRIKLLTNGSITPPKKFVNIQPEVLRKYFLTSWRAPMKFGEKVLAARLALNLSQTELAEKTGLTERSLYTYEQLNIMPHTSEYSGQIVRSRRRVSAVYITSLSLENTKR
jgi:hypothetical protein